MDIRAHRRLPQARIAMIPQPVLGFFYAAAIAVVDALLTCFGPVGRLPDRNNVDVDHQTDDELLNLCYSVPGDGWDDERTSSGCPPRITPDVVAKRVPRLPAGWPSEALAQDLVRNRTNIPVPPIRRVLNLNPDASVIVMDYIPGITLAEAWPNMRLWQKIRTAITLRSYVRQLRSIVHPRSKIPGPVLEGEEPGKCFASRIFGPFRPTKGPFATSEEFIRFFNNGMDQAALARLCVHKGPLPDDGTLVYSHVDLALRNLIVGEDGQLWLIDFTTAGFYPRWFEYVNMVMDARMERGEEYDAIWWAILPFIADPYFSICDWVRTVAPDCL